MPVIERQRCYITKADLERVEFQRIIKFMKKIELFECEIPQNWADSIKHGNLRGNKITSDSFHGIEAHWDKIHHDYKKLLTEQNKEKLIHVKFRANAFKHISGNPGTYDTEPVVQRNLSGISFAGDPTLHISYTVIYKVKDSYYTLDMRSTHSPDKTDILIPWTEDREAFFEQTETGLRELIFRIEDFIKAIDEEPALLDEMIGKNLLGPGPEDK